MGMGLIRSYIQPAFTDALTVARLGVLCQTIEGRQPSRRIYRVKEWRGR